VVPVGSVFRVKVDVHLTPDDVAAALRQDVLTGLTATPRWLPPKWFYDARGSQLFDEITRLPEYYLTRAEASILDARARDVAARTGATHLVELGSGTSTKTRSLLDALSAAGSLERFSPFDVDEVTLRGAAEAIEAAYPGVAVHAVCGDFERHLDRIPGGGGRLVAFLGSTIGNLDGPARAKLLASLAAGLRPGEWLLLGTDLVKAVPRLIAAYDDAEGVTAEFNRNVLHVVDRALDGDLDPAAFAHVTRWNPDDERMEMSLRAERRVTGRLRAIDLDVTFEQDEELRTELSCKFRREGVTDELATAGFEVVEWWTDDAGDFALSLSRVRER
jgi:L-histidine N-alpha-methyltransferase